MLEFAAFLLLFPASRIDQAWEPEKGKIRLVSAKFL
jgi:hypothetical protein